MEPDEVALLEPEHVALLTPPHRMNEFDVDRWLTWRTHFPRHDGGRFLPGCDLAAAYREKAVRDQLEPSRA